MEVRGNDMKLRFALAGLLVIASLALAAAQTAAPKDPELIDTQGYRSFFSNTKANPCWSTSGPPGVSLAATNIRC